VDEENIKAGKEFEKTIGYRRVIKRVCQAEDIEKNFFLEKTESGGVGRKVRHS
jgi:hypothetical protein